MFWHFLAIFVKCVAYAICKTSKNPIKIHLLISLLTNNEQTCFQFHLDNSNVLVIISEFAWFVHNIDFHH